jgi:TRAP-type C4-dicarboxylate transport system permease small subunit
VSSPGFALEKALKLRALAAVFIRFTEVVGVVLLTAMFASFIIQIVWRYILNDPLGWTLEACLLAWLWVVLWGGAFLLRDRDHVRFDILITVSPKPARLVMGVISGLAIIAAFAYSLPATYDFISFMAIEKSSILKIPFDQVFAPYLLFAGAVVLRYVLRVAMLLTGREPE